MQRFLSQVLIMASMAAASSLSFCASWSEEVVPLPQEAHPRPGACPLDVSTVVWLGPRAAPDDHVAAEDLVKRVRDKVGIQLTVRPWPAQRLPAQGVILGDAAHWPALAQTLRQSAGSRAVPPSEQGYGLLVTAKRILICGRDAAGTYYGASTLAQLVSRAQDPAVAPGVLIRDWPDLRWRGVMSAQLKPVDGSWAEARQFVDRCAALKLNLLYVDDYLNHFDGPHLDWSAEQTQTHNQAFQDFIAYARDRHFKIITTCGARKFPVIYLGKYRPEKPVYFFPDREGEGLMAKRVDELIGLVHPDAIAIGQDELVTAYPIHLRQPLLEHPIVGREFVPPPEKYAGVAPHELWSDFLKFYRDLFARRGVELCLWGDCLLSSEEFDGYPMAQNDGIYGGLPDNLYLARPTTPKDILLLDWHYMSTWCYTVFS